MTSAPLAVTELQTDLQRSTSSSLLHASTTAPDMPTTAPRLVRASNLAPGTPLTPPRRWSGSESSPLAPPAQAPALTLPFRARASPPRTLKSQKAAIAVRAARPGLGSWGHPKRARRRNLHKALTSDRNQLACRRLAGLASDRYAASLQPPQIHFCAMLSVVCKLDRCCTASSEI